MKLATCNEPWRDVAVEKVFEIAARIGFDGVEIAPFTLTDDVATVPADRRRRIRESAADAGVRVVGLHWLFVTPKGLHLTTPDRAVRQKSADYLKALVDFCSDIGGSVMVFGSPAQRSIEPPNTYAEGWKRAVEVFSSLEEVCTDRNVTICMEALAPKETNFIQTAAEAAKLADEVGHPYFDIMLDVKAMSSMPDGIIETIRKFGARAKHFHINEPSMRGAGMPPAEGEPLNVDFKEILSTLTASGYDGWVSLEPFVYEPDPKTIAEVGFKTIKAAMPG